MYLLFIFGCVDYVMASTIDPLIIGLPHAIYMMPPASRMLLLAAGHLHAGCKIPWWYAVVKHQGTHQSAVVFASQEELPRFLQIPHRHWDQRNLCPLHMKLSCQTFQNHHRKNAPIFGLSLEYEHHVVKFDKRQISIGDLCGGNKDLLESTTWNNELSESAVKRKCCYPCCIICENPERGTRRWRVIEVGVEKLIQRAFISAEYTDSFHWVEYHLAHKQSILECFQDLFFSAGSFFLSIIYPVCLNPGWHDPLDAWAI